jgi:hypothetical protein
MTTPESGALPSSFRDPSGFLFQRDGRLLRQVNLTYQEDYERLMDSGLYDELVLKGMLVAHDEVSDPPLDPSLAYKVIHPQKVGFISYPYEWCFSQLKAAAVLTLEAQKLALKRGMSLKDASAYNVQFVGASPVLIDSLSFERLDEGKPWTAYRQFCQHFLAPLALMAFVDVRLLDLLRVYIDGIPLDLASRLLPLRSYLSFGLVIHLHMHARAQSRFAGQDVREASARRQMSSHALVGLVDTLSGLVGKLAWRPKGTAWGDYYTFHTYSEPAMQSKRDIVRAMLEESSPATVWDLGANTGEFSRIAAGLECRTLAFDIDPAAVEHNYRQTADDGRTNLLPLVMDFTNPSPSQGWAHQERLALEARGPADLVMALALIHHLAIGNNLPLDSVARYFSRLGRRLIIEFVPKSDSQVQQLLASREDIFDSYHESGFEEAFSTFFRIVRRQLVADSDRTLYLMEAVDQR